MSSPTSPNTLADGVRNSIIYQLLNIHTAMPGKVLEYDFSTRKASVQPMVDKRYNDGTTQPMPILNSVPVVFPFSSGAGISFPVNEGDFCLLVFCERSIDNFISTGQQSPPSDPRKFDLSDGVAIMGLLPFNHPNIAENNTDLFISYNGSKIVIKESGDIIIETSNKVAIGNSSVEVLDVISQALGFIANPLGVSVPSTPFTGALADAAAAASLKTQIDAIKGSI